MSLLPPNVHARIPKREDIIGVAAKAPPTRISGEATRIPCAAVKTPSDPQVPYAKLREILEKRNVAVTAGTIDLGILMSHDLDGTSIDPRRVVNQLHTDEIFYHGWVATKRVVDGVMSRRTAKDIDSLTHKVVIGFLIELGASLFDFVPGPHLTFVDPRNYDNESKMVQDARDLRAGLRKRGLPNEKIVISLPGTEKGVAAAKVLELKDGIHTNLTHITSLTHALACLEARPTIMSVPVGRVLEWHEGRRGKRYSDLNVHPGIETIRAMAIYIRLHGLPTKLLGANFRCPQEMLYLEGLDAVSLTKMQIARLDAQYMASTDTDSQPQTTILGANRALFRARQAQYPTSYLSAKCGFLNSFSSETQSALSNILYWELGMTTVKMDELERIMKDELAWQLTLKFLDIRTLYSLSPKKKRGRKSDPEEAQKNDCVREAASYHDRSVDAGNAKVSEPPQSLIPGIDYF